MSDYKEIKVNVMGEVITVLDYGAGRMRVKPVGINPDTPQGKLRHLAEAHAIELLAQAHKRVVKREKHLPNQKAASEKKVADGTAREKAIKEWVDKHLRQRQYKSPPPATELARRLLRNGSGFKWPDGCKAVVPGTVEKIIRAHLAKGNNS